MATETERRFLIEDPDDARSRATEDEPIEQGYVAIDPDGTEVRVRQRGDTTVLTVKSGPGESRFERELGISAEDFAQLFELTARRRVRKRRHTIEAGELRYEIDVFEGDLEGLALVEVEFGSEAEAAAFEPPDWFGRELTGMDEYANVNLARDGLPEPS